MKAMKMKSVLILGLTIGSWLIFGQIQTDATTGIDFGVWGNGDHGREDSVRFVFSTIDTFGFTADADSVKIFRRYDRTLVDSTKFVGSSNKVATGTYEVYERAYVSTGGLGQYEVVIDHFKNGKKFTQTGFYEVRASPHAQRLEDMHRERIRLLDQYLDPTEYSRGVLLNDLDDSTEWTLVSGTQFKDEVNFKQGDRGIKLVSTNGSVAQMYHAITDREYHISNVTFYAYIDPVGRPHAGRTNTVINYIEFRLGADAGTTWLVYMSYTIADSTIATGWNKFVIPANAFSATGGATWDGTNFEKVAFFVDTDVGTNEVKVTFDGLYYDRRSKAVCLFRFDDAHTSQFDLGYQVMKEYGLRGTFFVITDNIGGTAFTLAEAQEMYEDGNDISCHADDGLGLSGDGEAAIREHLYTAYAWLNQNGFTRSSPFHAWGWDEYDSVCVRVAKERFLMATGGKHGIFHDHLELNADSAEDRQYTLPVCIHTASGPTVSNNTVKAWIDSTIMSGGPLVLGYHSFSTTGHSGVGIHIDSFRVVCEYLYQKRGEIVTMTFSEYYRSQYAQLPGSEIHDLWVFDGVGNRSLTKFPPYGEANKDSNMVYDRKGNWLGTLIYYHTGAIIDSVLWKKR